MAARVTARPALYGPAPAALAALTSWSTSRYPPPLRRNPHRSHSAAAMRGGDMQLRPLEKL